MAYATISDFIAVLGEDETLQLSALDDASETEIQEETIQESLDNASSEIDGHLAIRYRVPIAAQPPILKKYAIILARRDLHRYQRPEHVQADADSVIESLKRMAKGMEALIGADGRPIPVAEEAQEIAYGTVRHGHENRRFTHENLSTYGRLLRGY